MKILQITEVWPSAITRMAKQIGRHNKDVDLKLVTFHPKKPDAKEKEQIKTLWKWADLIDIQYWKSGAKIKELFPDLWKTKKKMLTHYNPYNLLEDKWEDYTKVIVVNNYQQSVLPHAKLIPLCIDLDFYPFNRSNYTTEPIVNMSVNRIEGKKGVIEVAQSCSDLGYRFLLVGRVSDGTYMERVKKAGGQFLEFRQSVSDEDVRKAYYDSAIHVCNSIDNFESGCYDDQTEILTDDGWKLFKDLNQTEKVATLNPETNFIEYHKPYKYVTQDFEGDLYCCENRSIDFAVTPNHNMWISKATTGENRKLKYKSYEFCRADQLKSNFKIKRTANWESSDNGDKDLNWFRFMGIYLSEGSLDHNSKNYWRIHIAAVKKSQKYKIKKLLIDMNWNFREVKDGFRILDQNVLAVYLSQFGTALKKYIPKEILNAPKQCIDEFLTWFALGDGSFSPKGFRVFYSNSKKMMDGIQECLLKIGNSGNISTRDRRGQKRIFENGRIVICKNLEYIIHERVQKTDSYIRKQMDMTLRPYNGKVYCVEVQNHILFVRRNNFG